MGRRGYSSETMAGDMVAQRGLATLVVQSYCPLAPQRNEKRSTLTKKGVYSSYAGAFYVGMLMEAVTMSVCFSTHCRHFPHYCRLHLAHVSFGII